MATTNDTSALNITSLPFRSATKLGFISLTITAALLFLTGLFSNGYVCFIIRSKAQLWRRSHEFMLFHLAVADMLASTCGVFSQWHLFFNLFYNGIPTTSFLCRLEYFLNSFGIMASVDMIVIFGIARYITLVKHASCTLNRKLATRMIFGTWLFVLVTSSPALFVFTGKRLSLDGRAALRCYYAFRDEGGKFHLRVRMYLLFLAIMIVLIPTTIIIFTYWKIIRYVWQWKHSKVQPSWSTPNLEARAMKIAVFIMITLVLCFAFYASGLVYNLTGFTSKIYGETNEHILIGKLLASANSCINPWIYVIFHRRRLRSIVLKPVHPRA